MGNCWSSILVSSAGADVMPLRLAVEACVGEAGERKPLREYILARAPTALDGLRQLSGSALNSAVDKLAADFKRWHAEPRTASAPPPSAPRTASSKHVRIEETALRGISLPQLRAYIAEAGNRCAAERWTSTAPGSSGVLTAKTMTLYDLATHAIQPLANATGLSVVETLASGPQPPAWFVSHWWGETLADFVRCLERHCRDRGLDEATTYYWVCAYALRQSALDEELQGGVGVSPFMRALQLTDGTVSVVDRDAIAVSRAWCALELYETILGRGTAYLHDIYTAHSKGAVGLVDGFAAVDAGEVFIKSAREGHFPSESLEAARQFALARAKASQEKDLVAIKQQVGRNEPLLDATVRARFAVPRLHILLRPDSTHGAEGAERVRALLDDLRRSQLRKLRASLDGPSAATRAELCSSLPPTLEELTLRQGGAVIARPLCEAIEGGRLPLLRSLDLGNNELDDEAGIAVGKALERRSALTSVDLWANKLGPKAGIALAKALEHNGTLTHLSLRENKLDGEAGTALAKALERNRTLTSLDLSSNALGAEALAALREVKARSSTLTALTL